MSLTSAFIALMVVDHVVAYRAVDSLALLSLIGATALALALVLNLARNYALINAPSRHHVLSNKVDLCVAAAVTLMLVAIHPLMATGIVIMFTLILGVVWLELRLDPPNPEALGPAEIKHILSGREPENVIEQLQQQSKSTLIFEPVCRFAGAMTGLIAIVVGGWLAAEKFITIGGMIAGILMSTWCIDPFVEFARRRIEAWRGRAEERADAEELEGTEEEFEIPADAEEDEDALSGLRAFDLQIRDRRDGRELLGPVSFDIPAGSATAITGPPGAGKSILLKSVVCTHPHPDLKVLGATMLKGWTLRSDGRWFDAVSVVYLPQRPMLLPGTPMENLLCFEQVEDVEEAEKAARKALARLDIFGIEADRLFNEPDVSRLSDAQQQMLCLARALFLNPDLLILDMPELTLPQAMHPALCDALHTVQRGGTAVLLATASRMIMDRCDEVMMLQDGYVADRGAPEEVLERHGSSWSRITVKRSLEEEKRLHAWLRSHFKRAGDADTLKQARALATEFLVLSSSEIVGEAEDEDLVSFDFRWDLDHFMITMHDDGEPLSTARLQATHDGQLGNKPEDVALRELVSQCDDFEQVDDDEGANNRRVIRAKIAVENNSKRGYR